MKQQLPALGAQEPADLQLGGHYPAIFVDFLEASAPVVVGSPRHVCLVETHILLFWLSQDSNFCKTFPIYLQLWHYKSACVGTVYALSDLNSCTVLILLGLSPSVQKPCLPWWVYGRKMCRACCSCLWTFAVFEQPAPGMPELTKPCFVHISFWRLMLFLWLQRFWGLASVRIVWCLITSKLTSQSFPVGALLSLLMGIQEPIFTEAARHQISLIALHLCHTGCKYTSRFRSYCIKLERLADTHMDAARSYKLQLLWEPD